ERAAATGGGFRLGAVWAAGAWRPERSAPFALIERLAAVPGVQLVSLQHGAPARDVERSAWRASIETPTMGAQSVVETASLIRRLDLVLTVDTMVAHLAGALAAPVWTLLHAEADWRWMVGRNDSPWYPTMRLFRQKRTGIWDDVLEEVLAALPAA
ncbi:MAG TPA: glycosyltransferase family 9 protein, partial [Stellaceae bacterium]|nr:glycosyltransferase family 9 protein [Stellaceae bacterium]